MNATTLPSFGELLNSLTLQDGIGGSRGRPDTSSQSSALAAKVAEQKQASLFATQSRLQMQQQHAQRGAVTVSIMTPESMPRIAHYSLQQRHLLHHFGNFNQPKRGRPSKPRFSPYPPHEQTGTRRNSLVEQSTEAHGEHSMQADDTAPRCLPRGPTQQHQARQAPRLSELSIPSYTPISALLRKRNSPQASPTSPLFHPSPSSASSTRGPLAIPTLPTLYNTTSARKSKRAPPPSHSQPGSTRGIVRTRHSSVHLHPHYQRQERSHTRNWSVDSASSVASSISSMSVASSEDAVGMGHTRTRSNSPTMVISGMVASHMNVR